MSDLTWAQHRIDCCQEGHLAALDLLQISGLVNYYGRTPENDNRSKHRSVSLHPPYVDRQPPYTCALPYSLPIVRPKPGERVQPIRTQARSATILPNFVGLKFQVHNGKVYHDITVTEDMVGHKLGEFSP